MKTGNPCVSTGTHPALSPAHAAPSSGSYLTLLHEISVPGRVVRLSGAGQLPIDASDSEFDLARARQPMRSVVREDRRGDVMNRLLVAYGYARFLPELICELAVRESNFSNGGDVIHQPLEVVTQILQSCFETRSPFGGAALEAGLDASGHAAPPCSSLYVRPPGRIMEHMMRSGTVRTYLMILITGLL